MDDLGVLPFMETTMSLNVVHVNCLYLLGVFEDPRSGDAEYEDS